MDPANYSVVVVEAGSFYETLNSNRTQVPGYNFYSALANFVGGLPRIPDQFWIADCTPGEKVDTILFGLHYHNEPLEKRSKTSTPPNSWKRAEELALLFGTPQ
ncbi:predicted protein [Aspergillus terreus NIH2624]|uniref:Uncharacterized protein n=1 Tax=Aspergillus terreus (strain NIH 2624 / FGSC A1156) TaxID=341663 RepID=Q0CMX8_ASPTN|nr:uncharacterized protein ATEG_04956 [Aspergillus terreus NIH2624]EAU34025.1 predicted protein [Aspergillus terreus NIH2624]